MGGAKMKVYSYMEYPNAERNEKMTIEELDEEIKRKLEESENMTEWPRVE